MKMRKKTEKSIWEFMLLPCPLPPHSTPSQKHGALAISGAGMQEKAGREGHMAAGHCMLFWAGVSKTVVIHKIFSHTCSRKYSSDAAVDSQPGRV